MPYNHLIQKAGRKVEEERLNVWKLRERERQLSKVEVDLLRLLLYIALLIMSDFDPAKLAALQARASKLSSGSFSTAPSLCLSLSLHLSSSPSSPPHSYVECSN